MNNLKGFIQAVSAKPHTVIHLGAGAASEQGLYQSLQVEKTIFVEANPELVIEARKLYKNAENVTVKQFAITTDDDSATLNVCNNARFSSLLTPAALLDYYPNIRIEKQLEVNACTLEGLCKAEQIDSERENLLVAEIQGMEKPVFLNADPECLRLFKWIIISTSDENLFTDQPSLSTREVSAALETAAFTTLVFASEASPFSTMVCLRNDAQSESLKLLEQQEALLATHQQNLRELQEQLASQHNELNHARPLAAISEKQQEQIGQLKEQLQRQKQSRRSLEKITQALEQKISRWEEKLSASEIISATRLKEIEQLQDTLRMNNKLMLKTDADLKDMQNQYRKAMGRQEKQNILLCELKEKLHLASVYYKNLNLQNLMLEREIEGEN